MFVASKHYWNYSSWTQHGQASGARSILSSIHAVATLGVLKEVGRKHKDAFSITADQAVT